jgi:hypothetical protein
MEGSVDLAVRWPLSSCTHVQSFVSLHTTGMTDGLQRLDICHRLHAKRAF